MSGYRGGIFKHQFYSRDYRDYLNCEGAQVKLPKKVKQIAVGLRDDPCDHNGAKEEEE